MSPGEPGIPGARRALGSRYELVDRLGRGAMGEVWRTHDRLTGEDVAAKLLRSDLAHDHDIIARFIQERGILMSLDHPNIVRVRDLVVEGDNLAIVMDLVQGEDLGRLLRAQGTLTPRDAIVVTGAVLDALAAAHAQRCLHRDVKPDNVLLTRTVDLGADAVRLSDFSISRLADDLSVQSTGQLGTPGYMPPELISLNQYVWTSDVYSAGVLLYQLLAGRTPFGGGGGPYVVTRRHVESEPPELPIAPALWAVLARMLAKSPGERLSAPDTAAALRALPAHVLDGPRIEVQPEPAQWAAHEGSRTVVRSWPSGLPGGPPGGPPGPSGPPPSRPPVPGSLTGSPSWPGSLSGAGSPTGSLAGTGAAPAASHRSAGRSDGASGRRARWPWAAGGVAVVAAAAVVLALVLGGQGAVGTQPGHAAPGTPSGPAHTADHILPTGLTITRAATYDAADSTARLTITYAADDATLRGPFLEVLPAGGPHGACPVPVFDGAQALRNDPVSSGIAADCAWSITPPPVPAHGSRQVVVTLPLHLGGGTLQAWLARVGASTASALSGVTSGAAYPVQRLSQLTLKVIGNTAHIDLEHQALTLQVLPSWGGAPDVNNPVFDSRTFDPTSPSSVLVDVAGSAKGLHFEACPVVTVDQGWYVGVLRPGSCRLKVVVGDLHTHVTFTIRRLAS